MVFRDPPKTFYVQGLHNIYIVHLPLQFSTQNLFLGTQRAAKGTQSVRVEPTFLPFVFFPLHVIVCRQLLESLLTDLQVPVAFTLSFHRATLAILYLKIIKAAQGALGHSHQNPYSPLSIFSQISTQSSLCVLNTFKYVAGRHEHTF